MSDALIRGSSASSDLLEETTPLSSWERDQLRRARGTRLPLVVVVVSLALAILLPRLAEHRIARLRTEINDLADPARLRIAQIQLEIALEASQRRGYLLGGDTALEQQFDRSRTRRREAERDLLTYTQRLDARGSTHLARAAVKIQALDRGLDSLISIGGAASATTLDDQRLRFKVIQKSADSLGAIIDGVANAHRLAINDTEQTTSLITAALVLLGLGASVLVARLERRVRALAVRLDDNERRLRANALERERLLDSEHAARQDADQRRTQLERVTESRGRLLRGFTHDVKNPLGAADGYLALLEDGVLGQVEQRQRVTILKVRRAIRHALELIAQLLDIARAENAQLQVHPEKTDVGEQVREVADAFEPQARAKGLDLEVTLPAESPLVDTDPTRLRQIVGNLVSNAIKYTPSGGHIALNVEKKRNVSSSDGEQVLVVVSDDGPGIPEDKLQMLFLEFTRLDPNAAEGAGIGLAISQRIAEALGGEITVESKVGLGSTFALHLPVITRRK
ncbi:MAG TPA: HAMP domain-containing sensor histidine kinase [Gemmatimonadaceae bacterium]|nr:HAMP domain-containing sensor histidine kinase [Gemmatimonadaceae bacterium]